MHYMYLVSEAFQFSRIYIFFSVGGGNLLQNFSLGIKILVAFKSNKNIHKNTTKNALKTIHGIHSIEYHV